MGAGSSGSKSGGGVTSITSFRGSKIDLSGSPLVYGKDDNEVTGVLRSQIEDFENTYANEKNEHAIMFDINGAELRRKVGDENSVKGLDSTNAVTMSHTHPRVGIEEGMLGGTFTQNDINSFVMTGLKTARARAQEGTYSISKGNNFDANGFLTFSYNTWNKHKGNYITKENELRTQVKSGKLSYDDYLNKNIKLFNSMMVNIHNDYRKNQNTYGYKYMLEKNKG